jgi:ATP-binding cassette subfamily B protein
MKYQEPLQSQGSMRALLLLMPYLWQFRTRVVLALSCLIAAKLATVAVPLALKQLVDYFEQQDVAHAVRPVLIPLALVLGYGALRFASVLFGELRDAVFGRTAERTLSVVGIRVFEHLHALDLEYHLSRRTGGLSRDIERGTTSTGFLLRSMVFSVVPIIVELVLVMVVLGAAFDWRYVLATSFAVAVYLVFTVIITEWRTDFVREANQSDSRANTRAIDSLLNFETVKYFNNEAFESHHFHDALRDRENAKVKNTLSLALLNTGQGFLIAATVTGILVMASYELAQNHITLGDLAMLNAYMIQLFIPLNAMGFLYREIKRCLADVEAMFGILAIVPKVRDKADAVPLPAQVDGIAFEHVSFSYDGKRQILHDVSFAVPAGHTVAVVGASGAGKSTLARLLYRFYDVSGGVVRFGGMDVRDVTQLSLRSAIGVVPQDTVLFNDTIYNNIAYGKTDATASEIDHAVRLAHLSGFIAQLPKGYQTLVGERGLKVSGGEKQRIAIARTILKSPRCMIFDEATSSLDTETEKAISIALREVSARRTTLIIAHRLSTVIDADNIVVLDQGRVAEQGTHAQLLAANGVYARLWRAQQVAES